MERQYLPCLISFVFAAAVALLKSHSSLAKLVAWLGCLVVLAAAILFAASSVMLVSGLSVVVLVAVACIAAQKKTKHSAICSALILFILALLYAILYGDALIERVAEGTLLAAASLLSVCFRKNVSLGFGSAVAFGIAVVCLVLSCLLQGVSASILQALAAAALLPLFPLHVGYIGLLSNLPGTLAAFLAFALPLAGWHSLEKVANLPSSITQLILVCAVLGAVCTSMRAFVQSALSRIVGAVGTLLLLPAWWIFATVDKVGSEAGAYVVAVGLVISGLMLCSYCIESRYGTQVLESLPGLARSMPKFGIGFSLLVMAGAGVPTFAVFSSFLLVLASSLKLGITDLLYVAVLWLVSFAIQALALQRLLFNEPRSNLLYTDLTRAEAVSLALIIALLVVGGLCPGMMLGLVT